MAARDLGITYGSLTIGRGQSGTVYNLTDRFSLNIVNRRGVLSFQVFLQDDSDITSSEATLVAAYGANNTDQALSVDYGGTDRFVWDPGASPITGMNTRPGCRKIGGPEDTAKSALYECTVVFEVPAASGTSGRDTTEGGVEVVADAAGRKTLTISGVYTALSTNTNATDQYGAAVAAYVSAVQSAVDGSATWGDAIFTAYAYDDQNNVLRFTHVYREIFEGETTSSTDDSELADERLVIRKTEPEVPRSSLAFGRVTPVVEIEVSCSASVIKSQTQDLETIWSGKLRPKILSKVRATTAGAVFVRSESPTYDYSNNTVSATMLLGATQGGLLSAREETQDDVDLGLRHVPVLNGDPFAVDEYQGPIVWIRTIRRTILRESGDGNANVNLAPDPGEGFRLIHKTGTTEELAGGQADDELRQLLTVDTWVYRRVNIDTRVQQDVVLDPLSSEAGGRRGPTPGAF